MILYLTNAPSEILALRSLDRGPARRLPAGPGRPRHRLRTCPTSTASEVVLVRLLGGASAWAEPFDELAPPLPGRRHPAAGVRWRGRARTPS